MAAPQYKQAYTKKSNEYSRNYKHCSQPQNRTITRKKVVKKKANIFGLIAQLLFAYLFIAFVSPMYTNNVTRPLTLKENKYPSITVQYNLLATPTSAYLHNNHFMGLNMLTGTNTTKPKMQKLYETYPIKGLENNIEELAKKYPSLKPSVFVWDYESGKYANFNADETYSTASIIKIPVLIQLFKTIEAGTIKLSDKIAMTDYYISEGSGSLQFKGKDAAYTVDDLARVMITESDNSATNILLSATGGMNAMNNSFREWGLQETRINDWLPDLAGTNVTTSKEMAVLIYNLDNPNFLTLASREKMVDYMSHVHNNRLIQAGLPSDALFIHKTGDIGKMLGDAGIVYTPSGKKYIVVMLVNRPYNSPLGKEFIVEASSLIYNYMTYSNL